MADKKKKTTTTRTVRIYTVEEASDATLSLGRQDQIRAEAVEESSRRRFVRDLESEMDAIWYGSR